MERRSRPIRTVAAAAVAVTAGVGHAVLASAASTPPPGLDVSWPQCGFALPAVTGLAIVGVTDGIPYSPTPCLADEYRWARGAAPGIPDLYMNLAEPGSRSVHWNRGGPRPCSGAARDAGCAYDYGWQAAVDALAAADETARAQGSTAAASRWWVDVETTNTWSSSVMLNTADVTGALDALRAAGVRGVGLYSTPAQWRTITGGAVLGGAAAPADWLAGAASQAQAASWCTRAGFSGGRVGLVQYPEGSLDGDVTC